MPENEIVLNENEVPEAMEDAFLSGLLDDDDYESAGEESPTGEGDADDAEAADPDEDPAAEAESAANEPASTEPAPEDTNPAAEEELMELVYNGQATSLPRSEVIKLAQKGMNYDHVRGQLDGLRSSETNRLLSQLASAAGLSEVEFLRRIAGNNSARRAEEFAAREGISPELAQRLLSAEEKVQSYEADNDRRSKADARNRMYHEFVRAYPDVKPEDIPPEVLNAVQGGEDLVKAYERYENGQLREKNKKLEETIAQMQKNESNRQKAVGSVRGSKAAAAEDAFLSGLFGD